MKQENWVLCPLCKNKTRLKLRADTELKNFPLFCQKCKQETLIEAQNLQITVIKEPDAQIGVDGGGCVSLTALGAIDNGYKVMLNTTCIGTVFEKQRDKYYKKLQDKGALII